MNWVIRALNASATTKATAMTIVAAHNKVLESPHWYSLSDSRMVSWPGSGAPPVILRPAVIETRSPVLCRTIHARVL